MAAYCAGRKLADVFPSVILGLTITAAAVSARQEAAALSFDDIAGKMVR